MKKLWIIILIILVGLILDIFPTQNPCWAVRLHTTGTGKCLPPPTPWSPKDGQILKITPREGRHPKEVYLNLWWDYPKIPVGCEGGPKGYQVRIGMDLNFIVILHSLEVPQGYNSYVVEFVYEGMKLGLNNLWWAVRAKYGNNGPWSKWSAPAFFILDYHLPPPPDRLEKEADHVAQPKLCDLAVTDIYCIQNKLAFTVENRGEGIWAKPMVGSIMVKIRVISSGMEYEISLDSLRKVRESGGGMQTPGGATNFITSIEIPIDSIVWVTIDSTNRTRESDENNNTLGRYIGPCVVREHPPTKAVPKE